jgi:hypothetical protein
LYVEHGVPAIDGWNPTAIGSSGRRTIGSFGIFGDHRSIDLVLEACERTNSRLVAILPCDDARRVGLEGLIKASCVEVDLSTTFVPDYELLARLSQCDVLYMPRRENELWCASGAVRLAMNLERPIIINHVRCYADICRWVTVANSLDEAVAEIENLSDPCEYYCAVTQIGQFRAVNRIGFVYKRLIDD